ncbi:MAG: DUF3039 domain-containing protein [Bowdeniella nasicola]|nr:DUF3039 domain-containing protein [Bowdeniella nasicola]
MFHPVTRTSHPHGEPSAPTAPQEHTGTAVLEREETIDDNPDRFAHYVRKDRVGGEGGPGRPVVALCGKVWVPKRNPENYPICPKCKAIYAELKKRESGGFFSRFRPGNHS